MQVATLIAVYANWSFAKIKGCGWRWAGVIWLYSLVFYIPLDFFKFFIRYILSGKAWDNLFDQKVQQRLSLNFLNTRLFATDFSHIHPCPCYHRLPLPQKRTMEERKGKLNGLLRRELFMASKHRTPPIYSLTRAASLSSLRLPSRPSDELRLLGMLSVIFNSINGMPFLHN